MNRQATRMQEPGLPPRRTRAATALIFSPTAWAKLLYLRDRGETEVGGLAQAPADNLLFVEDVQLVRQTCTAMTVAFEDAAVAEFFDQQVDRDLQPEQFARIWLHTHPGNCPEPSLTDERTFERAFGKCNWAVMFILARGGRSYARLRFNVGPGGAMKIPTYVDFGRPFSSSDVVAWEADYQANVVDASAVTSSLEDWPDDNIAVDSFANQRELRPHGYAAESDHEQSSFFERFYR